MTYERMGIQGRKRIVNCQANTKASLVGRRAPHAIIKQDQKLSTELIPVAILEILLDLVHEHRINGFFHGVQNVEHAVELRNLDELGGVV